MAEKTIREVDLVSRAEFEANLAEQIEEEAEIKADPELAAQYEVNLTSL